MLLYTAMTMLATAQVEEPGPNYALRLREAHADMRRLDPSTWPRYRYLLRPRRWDDKVWADRVPVIAGWLNHLSRSQLLYPLGSEALVPVGRHLLRVDVVEFGLRDAWDRMASPYEYDGGVAPVTVLPPSKGGLRWLPHYREARRWDLTDGSKLLGTYYESDGRYYEYTRIVREGGVETRYASTAHSEPPLAPPGTASVPRRADGLPAGKRQVSQSLLDGPEDARLFDEMVKYTGSAAWIVRADWWLNQALAAEGRAVGYPELLGFKDRKEFQALIGFDEKLFKRSLTEVRDAVGLSGVTLQPRALARWKSITGSYWVTSDFIAPAGATDPLEVVGADIDASVDAHEEYGDLPNGLKAMGAFNGKGVLQRSVPTNIATNHVSKSKDFAIHLAVSCVVCHGEGGLRDVSAWHRRNLRAPLKADFYEVLKGRYPDRDVLDAKVRELKQQYLTDLAGYVKDDRVPYERAIKAASGLDGLKFSQAVERAWYEYEDARVDQKFAAAEFGLTVEEFKARLKRAMDYGYKLYPPVYVRPRIGALYYADASYTIRQWEEVAGETWNLIRGVKTKD